MDKLKALVAKHWDVLCYLFFGVLTTAVNYIIYLPCYNVLGLSGSLSNAIAWAGAVITVFADQSWLRKTKGLLVR